MQQGQLNLMGRIDAPCIVPSAYIDFCKSFRDAVKMCWQLRRAQKMTQATLAQECGIYASHVTWYLNDGKRQQDLPGSKIAEFEAVCGNSAISQWIARQASFSVLEQMQADEKTSKVARIRELEDQLMALKAA